MASGGGSLNVQSEAFMARPTSNPTIVPQIGQEPKKINIGAKEFTPSIPTRTTQPESSIQPARSVNLRQYQ